MLMAEHEHLFMTTRLVSDIRPIFSTDADKVPNAAILVHKLHIKHYGQEGPNLDSFFVLDSEDLRSLKKTVDRALRKERLLSEFAKKSNITLLTRDLGKED